MHSSSERKPIKVRLSLPGVKSASPLQQFNKEGDPSRFWVGDRSVEFYVNTSKQDFDFWFIVEDIELKLATEKLPRERIFFLAAETALSEDFYITDQGMNEFLNQFGRIYSHGYWPKDNHYPTLPFLPWMYFANHGESIFSQDFDSNSLWGNANSKPTKQGKLFSIFCSNQTMSPMHKVRLDFARRLTSVFPELIDWYGNGINPLPSKAAGIAPYKYHFALENKRQNNVISEKLYDAFLGFSLPLYWGAPNVADYYDRSSLIEIDIFDFNSVTKIVEHLVESDPFDSYQSSIQESRRKVLDGNFAYRMAQIAISATENLKTSSPFPVTQIQSRRNFIKKERPTYRFARWIYFKFF